MLFVPNVHFLSLLYVILSERSESKDLSPLVFNPTAVIGRAIQDFLLQPEHSFSLLSTFLAVFPVKLHYTHHWYTHNTPAYGHYISL